MIDPLFDEKTIRQKSEGIELSENQIEAAKQWSEWLENNELTKERENYMRFAEYILNRVLGYPVYSGLKHEKDNMEFSFDDSNGHPLVVIEVKGSDQDLFSKQGRSKKEFETPISQTWNYMMRQAVPYGITTNYESFVLSMYSQGSRKLHQFSFKELSEDIDLLNRFVATFSYSSLADDLVETIFKESNEVEREFTQEFYKLFHETRLMLVKEFLDCEVSSEGAIHFAQLFLNRLMLFVFIY